MSHSYSSNRIHVVFSTRNRERRIRPDLQPKLWAYIAGVARNHEFETAMVGGVEDHAHTLLILHAALPLAKAIQLMKGVSSKWLNESGDAGKDFAWQEGYGAFSVSASHTDAVIEYIQNQAIHHAKRNFEEEFLGLLKRHGIEYDPRYVFG